MHEKTFHAFDDQIDYYHMSHNFVSCSKPQPRPLSMLYMVIPFGKLFVKNDGRAEWTGYDNAKLEIWAILIYAIDDDGLEKWAPVERKTFTVGKFQ